MPGADGIVVKVDNIVAVQNLEKMAKGYGYGFSYKANAPDAFEVTILSDGKAPPKQTDSAQIPIIDCSVPQRLVVAIGSNTMGKGSDELGAILIKGFIYSLTELAVPPATVIFLTPAHT